MASFFSDRRLYVNADRSEVVEEGDLRAAFLLVGAGRAIPAEDADRYGLSFDRDAGRVVLPGEKQAAKPGDKMSPPPENKAMDAEESKDYADMGYQELRRLAAERDLDVSARPKKDELVDALEAAEE